MLTVSYSTPIITVGLTVYRTSTPNPIAAAILLVTISGTINEPFSVGFSPF